MINDAINLLNDYGWAALILAVASFVLINYLRGRVGVWYQRDQDRTAAYENMLQAELKNHQFFTNLNYKLNNELPTLALDATRPVRQKMFRKLLQIKFEALREVMTELVEMNLMDESPSQWANIVQAQMQKAEDLLRERCLREGIPSVVVNNFFVWHMGTNELSVNYINDLGISPIYDTNIVRTNTFLYMMNLKLITLVGDAERTLTDINGEISGKQYKGETIE